MKIHGTHFRVNDDGRGDVWITHKHWSMVGNGPTIDAAILALEQEALDLAPQMDTVPEGTVNDEWRRMREFCLRVRDAKTTMEAL